MLVIPNESVSTYILMETLNMEKVILSNCKIVFVEVILIFCSIVYGARLDIFGLLKCSKSEVKYGSYS